MEKWLDCALDYIPRWLEFQVRMLQTPGCIIAVSHRQKVVLEQAFGVANMATGEALTTRHRFRIGSQSKSFTPAGILKKCGGVSRGMVVHQHDCVQKNMSLSSDGGGSLRPSKWSGIVNSRGAAPKAPGCRQRGLAFSTYLK